jgi:CubicO group peptidase (beta-lactamase class C family)
LSVQKENTITLKHQLTMTTGLDDSGNLDCTDPNCLTYMADVGTRWSYHNAPYTLLGSVIEQVSGVTLNSFVASKVNSKIGAFGIFNTFGYNQVYISTPRSMARFGLLLLANGNWNGTAILNDPTYLDAMHNTSQNFNLSYGYLTWLNGKNSYMIPQSQFVIPGKSIPSAPDDLYAALGKNSQIINVVPSKNMVLIRMGDGDGISLVSNQYNDSIWKRINSLNCVNNINEFQFENIEISPNPSNGRIKINVLNTDTEVRIFEMTGKNISVQRIENEIIIKKSGVYIIELQRGMSTIRKRVIVEN